MKEVEKTQELEELDEDIFEDIKPKKEKKSYPKKLIIILAISLVVLILFICIFIKLETPSIKRNGPKEILLTVNSEYTDLGATAKVKGKDKTFKIKTTGKVDTSKVGTYTITYKIKNLFFTKKTFRVVSVLENGPTITLEGDKETSICPNATYEEIGFTATNSKEEDLTEKVKTKVEKDIVTYTIKDNDISFTTSRKLIREDKEAPEIKLNGNDHIYITVGSNYNEQGASANDKCDGDLSDKVIVEGTVDKDTLGDYDITYKVSDNAGNEATASRKVTVQKQVVKKNASLGCGEAGVIYLTFDDGPNATNTPKVLEVLKKYGVKATFFVTGNGTDELIKREYNEGHLVALHTYTHSYPTVYASLDAYYKDLNLINDKVEKLTGKRSNLIRFPGGSSNTVSRSQGHSPGLMSTLTNDVESKGYAYFDWNVDSKDAESATNCYQVSSNAINGLSKSRGNVILMHDIHGKTAGDCGGKSAVEKIIEYGLNNGYTFKTLDSSVVCHHKVNN